MAELSIEHLAAPRPCGVCGRPTTRYSPELGMVFCGREEPPVDGAGATGDFTPVMRGNPRRLRFWEHARR